LVQVPQNSASIQRVCVLLGHPVAGNPTQFMMEASFAHHGLDWRYLSCDVPPERLGDAVRGMRALGFQGGNVTKPHKLAVIEHLDRLTESAALIGAVNCLFRESDELVGDNTDGRGFLTALRTLTDPAGKRVVLLGAGGAGRAIAVELALAKAAEILVVNRDKQRGEDLARLIHERLGVPCQYAAWEGDFIVPAEVDVLIQATSIGLNDPDAEVPVVLDRAPKEAIVADVIASPPETRFLDAARRRGHRTLDGLGMIVQQGVLGFERWTGIAPDAAVMREACDEFTGF
jgi:shikimate dehydrogenase